MPNRNKKNGTSFEQRTANRLEAQGYLAVRSAGSHTEVDVIGIHPEKKEIVLIQCKPASMRLVDGSLNAEGKRIAEALLRFDGQYTLKAFVLTTRKCSRREKRAI